MHSIFSRLNISYLDSASQDMWSVAKLENNKAGLKNPSQCITAANVIPDVKGMGLKDALYLLENKGLVAIVSGKGRVVSQNIMPGTNFKKGQKIILLLN
jgi:cell division protein FtsI (penicillin-binding protein 3)